MPAPVTFICWTFCIMKRHVLTSLITYSLIARFSPICLCTISGCQVANPLRAMVMGAPLEDVRHLTQRYERLRQEADAQVSSQSYSLPSFTLKSHGFGFWFVSHPIS
jgi:hypothetical protein